jgi:hypothetical protein
LVGEGDASSAFAAASARHAAGIAVGTVAPRWRDTLVALDEDHSVCFVTVASGTDATAFDAAGPASLLDEQLLSPLTLVEQVGTTCLVARCDLPWVQLNEILQERGLGAPAATAILAAPAPSPRSQARAARPAAGASPENPPRLTLISLASDLCGLLVDDACLLLLAVTVFNPGARQQSASTPS